jgi:hypothetical protein
MKSKDKIRKEYMDLKLENFSKWYTKLSDPEKVMFNKVISEMRDEFFNNKEDKNA